MANVSTVFIVTAADKNALESWASGDPDNGALPKVFDCVAVRELRVQETTSTTPTHYLGHGYCTTEEQAVLNLASDLELLSIDVVELNIKPIDHVNQVLTEYGLEFIPEAV